MLTYFFIYKIYMNYKDEDFEEAGRYKSLVENYLSEFKKKFSKTLQQFMKDKIPFSEEIKKEIENLFDGKF